jgi:hypothetical protein
VAYIPLILAILVLLSVTASFVVAILATDLKSKGRIFKHNISHALQALQIALDKISIGQLEATEAGKAMVKATKAWVHPIGKQEVPLREYFKPLVSTYQMIEFYPLADPVVNVDVGELNAIMVNALQNAMEARQAALINKTREEITEGQITIRLDENIISISNPANQTDRNQVLKKSGSTRDEGRGQGRDSIRQSCKKINWQPAWSVSGTRVITTLAF